MIKDIIWLLPILCLSGSILYCSIRLWLMYKEEIYICAHRMLAKSGFWKTGMGRLDKLRKYSCWYMLSTILSVVIFCVVSFMTKAKADEEVTAFAGRPGIVEFDKILATLGFVAITVVESLLMCGCDFSKVNHKLSEFKSSFGRNFFRALPVFIWVFAGSLVYKDYFLGTTNEWVSSLGRILQLFWGGVSIGVFLPSIFTAARDMREN